MLRAGIRPLGQRGLLASVSGARAKRGHLQFGRQSQGVLQRVYSSDATTQIAGGRFVRNLLLSTSIGAAAYGGGAYVTLENPEFQQSFRELPGGKEALVYVQQAKDATSLASKQAAETLGGIRESAMATLQCVTTTLGSLTDTAKETIRSYTDSTKKVVADARDRISLVVGMAKGAEKLDEKSTPVGVPAASVPADPVPAPKKMDPAKPPSSATAWKKSEPPKYPLRKQIPSKPPAAATPVAPVEKSPNIALALHEFDGVPVAVRLSTAIKSLQELLVSAKLPQDVNAALKTELAKAVQQLSALENEQAVLVGAVIKDQEAHFEEQLDTMVSGYRKSLAALQGDLERTVEAHIGQARSDVAMAKDEEARSLLATQTAEFERTLRETLSKQAEEIEAHWRREVRERVDRERAGRLARLDHLDLKIRALEKVAVENGESVERMFNLQALRNGVAFLKQSLQRDTKAPLGRQLSAIEDANRANEMLKVVLQSIGDGPVKEGVMPAAELERWWTLSVKPAVRATALMPEDGGFISYTISSLLSRMLFPKGGLVAGDAVDDVLARSDYHMLKGDIDSAAREVNQLKGWPKRVAGDWLEAARKRLEVEQAVEILEADVGLQELGAV